MYYIFKRFFDILFSVLALLVLAPLLIPIVIALKCTGEGYIFYKQERVGYKNSIFQIYKFATMLKDSPNMQGGLITAKKDPRLTPLGGFLRASKINELPQLLNILFGQMSFVGPRPVMPKSFQVYADEIKSVIYQSKPGLTGIGSIIFRDEEQLLDRVAKSGQDPWEFYKDILYPHKGKVEKWYQEHKSFTVDFMCLVLTACALVSPASNLVYKVFRNLPKRNF